ncbi:Autophagy protein 7 [Umbelopsis sp. WA50703]
MWHRITSGETESKPMYLASFLALTYADLKKHKFYYWFSFPALLPTSPWVITDASKPKVIKDIFSKVEIESLQSEFGAFKLKHQQDGSSGFFCLQRSAEKITIGPLSQWKEMTFSGGNAIIGFVDPSGLAENPGWPLRNLLAHANVRYGLHRLQVLCVRDQLSKNDLSLSLFLEIELPQGAIYGDNAHSIPKSVGWEKNTTGKLAPRLADLAPMMDPKKLADTAVDLNLKLMRWRLLPELELEKIQNTKCLLLGAGTLGCYVARSLLGWGIRKITFVDYGKVSFSNPVRQPLFEFEDCLNGGAPKAVAAAASLRRIYPGVDATGIELSIPMPGHPITNDNKTARDVDHLTELIASHDVIYLLMDSRESRWLPTLLGAKMRKLVINAALGFDTYLVMRHGVPGGPSASVNDDKAAIQLGCYYCNDIVAPADSLTDRTLDQQCTVTRPGLSAIASALAVELMVSVLHHKDGIYAQADAGAEPHIPSTESSPLGLVPHQIRGFLTHFNNMLITGRSYDRCTACSEKVIQKYVEDGFVFLKNAFNDPEYLEEVTGLAQMKRESEELMQSQDWVDDDTDSSDGVL